MKESTKAFISIILPIAIFFLSGIVFAQDENTEIPFSPTEEWSEYAIFNGIKVEYMMKVCIPKTREQNLLLFRYTNTTAEDLSFKWTLKVFRDGHCTNCERLDNPEYTHTVHLSASESIEANISKMDRAMYVFGNYVKHVPGMSDQRLTGIEFVNVTVKDTEL